MLDFYFLIIYPSVSDVVVNILVLRISPLFKKFCSNNVTGLDNGFVWIFVFINAYVKYIDLLTKYSY